MLGELSLPVARARWPPVCEAMLAAGCREGNVRY